MQQPNDSLQVLELLGEHHEFMETIKNVAVMDDVHGDDSAWWSDYRSDSEQTKSLYNIKNFTRKNYCRGHNKRSNVKFVDVDVSNTNEEPESFEIIWANNCLQRSSNPFKTLRHWWDLLKEDGMLCLNVPQTNYIDDLGQWKIESRSGEYFSWNMVNLIQSLAVCGFDCRDGHFKQQRHDPYIWASVYKGSVPPQDPDSTSWYDLKDLNLTPIYLDDCINRFGYVKHEFLKVEWLDHSVYDLRTESIP
jgi:hypothetical protein